MKMLLGAVALIGSLSAIPVAAQSTQPPNPFGAISYDEFALLSRDSRQELFQFMRPEKRAAIVREHLHRWSMQNDARLNDAQRQFLDDAQKWATPEQYGATTLSRTRDTELHDMETTARQLFSPEGVEEILYLGTARDRQ
jgi:hypothetical protein